MINEFKIKGIAKEIDTHIKRIGIEDPDKPGVYAVPKDELVDKIVLILTESADSGPIFDHSIHGIGRQV